MFLFVKYEITSLLHFIYVIFNFQFFTNVFHKYYPYKTNDLLDSYYLFIGYDDLFPALYLQWGGMYSEIQQGRYWYDHLSYCNMLVFLSIQTSSNCECRGFELLKTATIVAWIKCAFELLSEISRCKSIIWHLFLYIYTFWNPTCIEA